LTVDFVVCTLTVKKKIRAGFDMSDRTIPLLVKDEDGDFLADSHSTLNIWKHNFTPLLYVHKDKR
jgi:hypothetical protein